MPDKRKTIIERLRAIAGELNITRGSLSGQDARRLAEDLNGCIDDLERGNAPGAVAEDEPPPTGTGG